MKHFGDITKIDGHKVPLVDIVTGGSPCQDLSVAGKRSGMKKRCHNFETCGFEIDSTSDLEVCPLCGSYLDLTRSGLFMEQIRVIKEMRDESIKQLRSRGATFDIRCVQPRYMVWENVPGAFSSHKGEDFRCVLEDTAKVADKDAVIPGPPKGKWSSSGCIMGDGWSIAWRVHDAQFWGVPQRRRRIALVADFGGETAPEILFERKGVSGDSEQGEQEGQEIAGAASESLREPGAYTLKIRGGVERDCYGKKAGKGPLVQTELSATLGVSQDQTLIKVNGFDAYNQADTGEISKPLTASATDADHTPIVYGMSAYNSNAMKSSSPSSGIYEADTTRTLDNNGGNPDCNQGGMMILEGNYKADGADGNGVAFATVGDHENRPTDMTNLVYQKTTGSLCASGYDKLGTQEAANDMYVIQAQSWDGSQVSPTLTANNAGGAQRMPDKDNFNAVVQSLETFHCVAENEKTQTLKARDYKDPHCVAYGLDRASYNQGQNAQFDFAIDQEKVGTQVAKGPGAVCTKGVNNAGTQNKILCLLSETYGEETVEKWGIAILAALQSSEILQSGVYESSVQSEAENWQKLDGGTPPCPSVVAGWLLRDMWKQQECGCSPQGRQSTEQRFEQSNKSMPELSQQSPQTCKDLFDMWEKGERLWLLREALSEIQKIRQSIDDERQPVRGCAIVRRLTPLEAERLQGFPDHWTDIGEWIDSKGKKHKDADSPRYKALGNSIALPFWRWMAKRMINILKGDGIEKPTMASLFDGIGGFPLSFSTHGAKAIWASEIEEFPIAVTKIRFPEDEDVNFPSEGGYMNNESCLSQDGIVVLEGNGSRPSHKGDGYRESNVSYTLNSTEQHAVCCQMEAEDVEE